MNEMLISRVLSRLDKIDLKFHRQLPPSLLYFTVKKVFRKRIATDGTAPALQKRVWKLFQVLFPFQDPLCNELPVSRVRCDKLLN